MRKMFLQKIVLVSASILSLVSLKVSSSPFVWIFVLWAIAALSLVKKSFPMWLRLASLYGGVILLVLAGFEGYLAARLELNDRVREEAINASGQLIPRGQPDSLLGWVAAPSRRVHWSRYLGENLLFEIDYQLDENGLRESNAVETAQATECILFFGGSFTFGDGVGDRQTMPYLVSSMAGNRYRVYNFGYSGYGPHQMLAMLQDGRVDRILSCEPKFVIYLGIPHHVRRSANKTLWLDHSGPRYRLTADGSVRYAGQFKTDTIASRLRWQLRKSHIFRVVTEANLTSGDFDLYTGIVDESRHEVASRYPGAEFIVLFWDAGPTEESMPIAQRLREKGMTLYLVSEIIPNFSRDETAFIISEYDRHPNAIAHNELARFVVNQIIQGGSESLPSPIN